MRIRRTISVLACLGLSVSFAPSATATHTGLPIPDTVCSPAWGSTIPAGLVCVSMPPAAVPSERSAIDR